ncbi:DUF397 domain-containing protein [Streptomyces sp. NBC_00448]
MKSTDIAPETSWYKSSYSGAEGNACVEIAALTQNVGIRDSKDKQGPALLVTPSAWSSFLDLVRSGAADFDIVQP